MNPDLRKACLQEEIKISRALLEIGYFPDHISLNRTGGFILDGRQSCPDDEKIMEMKVAELTALEEEGLC